jgi:heptosyltransferase-2
MTQASPQRILVRGVNWLGDAVLTTPALLRLREARPKDHITLLTPAKLADLWMHHPALDNVMTFTAEQGPVAIARRLRPLQFDTALILPNSPRSALEAFLARIPVRIGHARAWRTFLLTQAIPSRPEETPMRKRTPAEVRRMTTGTPPPASPSPSPSVPARAHHLYQYLHLTAALGARTEPTAPCVVVTPAEVDQIRRRLNLSLPPAGTPVLGLNAGAEYGPAKRWPQENFVATAIELQRVLHCHWWILGGPANVMLAENIAAGIRSAKAGPTESVVCLAGKTTLRELCGVLKACDLVLTNDTGPMHLAAAVGTRVVVPFGSTSPELTGPGLPGDPRHRFLKSDAPCAPCFLRECPIDFRCMRNITVARVVTAVVEGLEKRTSGD